VEKGTEGKGTMFLKKIAGCTFLFAFLLSCNSYGISNSREDEKTAEWVDDNLLYALNILMPIRQPGTVGGEFFDWRYVAVITLVPSDFDDKELSCVLIEPLSGNKTEAYVLYPTSNSIRCQLRGVYADGTRDISSGLLSKMRYEMKYLQGGEMEAIEPLVKELGNLSISATPPPHFMYDGTTCELVVYSGSQTYNFEFMLEEGAMGTRKKDVLVDWIVRVVDKIREMESTRNQDTSD